MRHAWTIAAALAASLLGCAAPSLHPLYTPELLVQDSGLVGEWATEGPTVTRVAVEEGKDGRYEGALTIHHQGELKTGLNLEVSLTDIGDERYVDLYLARPDREKLAGHYGFLALPVHQFMMVRREGDTLRVWAFEADWVERAGAKQGFACEVLPIAGRHVAVVTADSDSLREFLRAHAHDAGALSPPMIFHRVGRVPSVGLVEGDAHE